MSDARRLDDALNEGASVLSAMAAHHEVPPVGVLVDGSKRTRRPAIRRLPIAVSVVVVVGILTGVVLADRGSVTLAPAAESPPAEGTLPTEGDPSPEHTPQAEGSTSGPVSWTELPAPPYAPVWGHSITFTGEGVLVWGGVGDIEQDERAYPRGGAYLELPGGAWHDLPGLGEARWGHAAVWTGHEVVLWGGSTENTSASSEGARVTVPSLDYRAVSPAPFGMAEPIGVWTGEDALFWGEPAPTEAPALAGPQVLRYRPATDSWDVGAAFPGRSRAGASAVWTGSELVVWGGLAWDDAADAPVAVADGYAYDPASDAWRRIAPGPLSGRFRHASVWTGEGMLVWGGAASEEPGDVLADGAVYSVATDSWAMMPPAPLDGRDTAVAAAVGDQVVIVGGQTRRSPSTWVAYRDGAVFSASGNVWAAPFQTGFGDLDNALLGAAAGDAVLLWHDPEGLAGQASVALLRP